MLNTLQKCSVFNKYFSKVLQKDLFFHINTNNCQFTTLSRLQFLLYMIAHSEMKHALTFIFYSLYLNLSHRASTPPAVCIQITVYVCVYTGAFVRGHDL